MKEGKNRVGTCQLYSEGGTLSIYSHTRAWRPDLTDKLRARSSGTGSKKEEISVERPVQGYPSLIKTTKTPPHLKRKTYNSSRLSPLTTAHFHYIWPREEHQGSTKE